MTKQEFNELEPGDMVSIKQLPDREGLVVRVKNHPTDRLEIYVQGVGLIMDAKPDDLTFLRKET